MINEIDKKILKYLEEGLSQIEIAEKIGLNQGSISHRIKKMREQGIIIKKGLDEKDKKILKYLEEGLSQTEIAEKIGLARGTIQYRIQKMKESGVEIPPIERTKKRELDEIDKKILKYLEEGLSQTEIAEKIGLTHGAISLRIKKMIKQGISIKKGLDEIDKKILKYLEEGLSQTEIAEKIGLARGTIPYRIQKMKENGVEIPPIERTKKRELDEIDKKILKYLEEGLSQTEIAEKIGLSNGAISYRIKKMREQGIIIKKGLSDKDKSILNDLDKGMSQTKISRKLNISRRPIFQRAQIIEKYNSQELVKGIIKLIKTKHATLEQIQIIADYYGVDLNKTFDSLDER